MRQLHKLISAQDFILSEHTATGGFLSTRSCKLASVSAQELSRVLVIDQHRGKRFAFFDMAPIDRFDEERQAG